MARENAHAARRSANRTYRGGGHQDANRIRVEDGNRASSTYRRRYRDREASQVRVQPRSRLVDRMTYGDGNQVNTGVRGGGNTFARSVNTQRTANDIAAQDTQGSSLFCTQETQSTQGSSLFCTQVTASQAPALAPLPKPKITRKSRASVPAIKLTNKLTNKPKGTLGNRGNTYRGKDIIKLAVQNPKLRAIFANKPLPRAPKKRDGPILRMGPKDRGLGSF